MSKILANLLRINAQDGMHFGLQRHFSDAIAFISTVRKQGACLVHCKQGKSRSLSILIAYMLSLKEKSLKDIYGYLSDMNVQLSGINEHFQNLLREFEKQQHNLTESTDYAGRGGVRKVRMRQQTLLENLTNAKSLPFLTQRSPPSLPRPTSSSFASEISVKRSPSQRKRRRRSLIDESLRQTTIDDTLRQYNVKDG